MAAPNPRWSGVLAALNPTYLIGLKGGARQRENLIVAVLFGFGNKWL
jgi:hypothetical protein